MKREYQLNLLIISFNTVSAEGQWRISKMSLMHFDRTDSSASRSSVRWFRYPCVRIFTQQKPWERRLRYVRLVVSLVRFLSLKIAIEKEFTGNLCNVSRAGSYATSIFKTIIDDSKDARAIYRLCIGFGGPITPYFLEERHFERGTVPL